MLGSEQQPVAFHLLTRQKNGERRPTVSPLNGKPVGQGIWVNGSTCSKFLFVITFFHKIITRGEKDTCMKTVLIPAEL